MEANYEWTGCFQMSASTYLFSLFIEKNIPITLEPSVHLIWMELILVSILELGPD